MSRTRSWIQFNIAPANPHDPAFYRALERLADTIDADNFFFMHKPPGLRARFEIHPDRRATVLADIDSRLAEIKGLSEAVRPAVYEPEALLFGGATSMTYVHRVFTTDSRAWLAYHQMTDAPPPWAFSLALQRHLLTGLGISGWEDLDVWDRIARQAYRRLPSAMTGDRVDATTAAIRAMWDDSGRLRAQLNDEAGILVDKHGERLEAIGREWLDGYFADHDALIGPREAAAFATIFHWNRGRLSAASQALIVAALADRSHRP